MLDKQPRDSWMRMLGWQNYRVREEEELSLGVDGLGGL